MGSKEYLENIWILSLRCTWYIMICTGRESSGILLRIGRTWAEKSAMNAFLGGLQMRVVFIIRVVSDKRCLKHSWPIHACDQKKGTKRGKKENWGKQWELYSPLMRVVYNESCHTHSWLIHACDQKKREEKGKLRWTMRVVLTTDESRL